MPNRCTFFPCCIRGEAGENWVGSPKMAQIRRRLKVAKAAIALLGEFFAFLCLPNALNMKSSGFLRWTSPRRFSKKTVMLPTLHWSKGGQEP